MGKPTTNKYVLLKSGLSHKGEKEFAEDFESAFMSRILETQVPPEEWLKERKIVSWGHWATWLTNGEGQYCIVNNDNLIPFYGDDPIGTRLQEQAA